MRISRGVSWACLVPFLFPNSLLGHGWFLDQNGIKINAVKFIHHNRNTNQQKCFIDKTLYRKTTLHYNKTMKTSRALKLMQLKFIAKFIKKRDNNLTTPCNATQNKTK